MSALRALRRNYPEIVGRQFHTERAYAIEREPAVKGFVTGRDGRAYRFASESRTVNDRYPRHGSAGRAGTTWRRRIAEQFVHQEGVSL